MRIAIAGAGLMGRWHAYYARQCGAAVCAVIDPNLRETELPRRFPGAAGFTALEPALLRMKPDVLHVCAPSAAHEELIEQALDAGVHALVEKPLARSETNTTRLVRKAVNSGLFLNPVHQYIFQDGFLKAARSLKRIGTPLHFDAVVRSAGGAHLNDEQLDSLVADILPHPISVLDALFPRILADIDWNVLHCGPGEWRVVARAGGLTISLLVSLSGRPTESSMRLTGTTGTIHVDFFHGFEFTESGNVSRLQKIQHPFSLAAVTFLAAGRNLAARAVHREPAYPGLRTLIHRFYRAVRLNSEPPLSAEHVIAVARTRDLLTAGVEKFRRP